MISIADLIAYVRHNERQVETRRRRPGCRPSSASSGPSATARTLDGVEHVALVHGDIGDGEDVLVRVHSECLTGDVFGSRRCDCGPQLDAALRRVAAEGRGVVLYMRGHEGRGIGLLHKLQAYAAAGRRRRHRRRQPRAGPARRRARLRHRRADPRRPRRAHACACSRTTRPSGPGSRATASRSSSGCRSRSCPTADNLAYLRTKRDRMGHDLPSLDRPVDPTPRREPVMSGSGAPASTSPGIAGLRVAVVAVVVARGGHGRARRRRDRARSTSSGVRTSSSGCRARSSSRSSPGAAAARATTPSWRSAS